MPAYYEFEVALRDVEPRPWRRFLLRESATFWQLHRAIQAACGWSDYHLFEFRTRAAYAGKGIAGIPDGEGWSDGEPVPDAKRVPLRDWFAPGRRARCIYVYDFGDDWEHDVVRRARVMSKETFARRLLAAEGVFPPEDCGGTSGFAELLEAVRTGEDREGRLEWLEGMDWSPELDLARLRRRFDRAR